MKIAKELKKISFYVTVHNDAKNATRVSMFTKRYFDDVTTVRRKREEMSAGDIL